jgi:hypothetical protein
MVMAVISAMGCGEGGGHSVGYCGGDYDGDCDCDGDDDAEGGVRVVVMVNVSVSVMESYVCDGECVLYGYDGCAG